MSMPTPTTEALPPDLDGSGRSGHPGSAAGRPGSIPAGGVRRTGALQQECNGRPRFWILPVAILGVAATMLILFTILAGAGVVSYSTWRGIAAVPWILFPLGAVSVWVVVVVLVRPWSSRHGDHWSDDRTDALEIVRRRFALGEITREQKRATMRELDGHP